MNSDATEQSKKIRVSFNRPKDSEPPSPSFDVGQKVIEIISGRMGSERQISESTHFIRDLGADSLDFVEIVMAIEEAFGIDFPESDQGQVQTVGDAIRYVEKRFKPTGGKQLRADHPTHEKTSIADVEQKVLEIVSMWMSVPGLEMAPGWSIKLLVSRAPVTTSIGLETEFVRDLHATLRDYESIGVSLRDAFGLEVPFENQQHIQSVEDVIRYVKRNAKK
jgi:acyl carrier protein